MIEASTYSIKLVIHIFDQINGCSEKLSATLGFWKNRCSLSYACLSLNMYSASILTNTSQKNILGKFIDYGHHQ